MSKITETSSVLALTVLNLGRFGNQKHFHMISVFGAFIVNNRFLIFIFAVDQDVVTFGF